MAIVELYDSWAQHRTMERWDATAKYHMLESDYWRGKGDVYTESVNGGGTLRYSGWVLPWEGWPYSATYNTYGMPVNLVCTDVDARPITGGSFATGAERILEVTYTWSNDSRIFDAPRANAASSWRMWFSGNIEYNTADSYTNLNDGQPKDFMDQWFTARYGTAWTNIKNDIDAANKFKQRHDTEVPVLEMRSPRFFFHFRFYTDTVLNLEDRIGYVNTDNFIWSLYNRRDLALAYQGKPSAYVNNDFLTASHVGKWMMVDINQSERTSSLMEYEVIWEYNHNQWDVVGGIDTERYPECAMYLLVQGYDSITPWVPF